jgi:hypothetical protein
LLRAQRIDISLPEFLFIAATRGILGTGIGLLVAGRLSRKTRRYVGATLALVGALTTIPSAIALFAGAERAKGKGFQAA